MAFTAAKMGFIKSFMIFLYAILITIGYLSSMSVIYDMFHLPPTAKCRFFATLVKSSLSIFGIDIDLFECFFTVPWIFVHFKVLWDTYAGRFNKKGAWYYQCKEILWQTALIILLNHYVASVLYVHLACTYGTVKVQPAAPAVEKSWISWSPTSFVGGVAGGVIIGAIVLRVFKIGRG